MLTKKGDRRTKPLRPPVQPLRRLIIGAQHTIKYLETHPTAWLWWAGRRQGRKAELEETGFRCLLFQGMRAKRGSEESLPVGLDV
jgi:hypothetical protein